MSYQTHIIKGLGGYKTIDCFTFDFIWWIVLFFIFYEKSLCLEVNKKSKKLIKSRKLKKIKNIKP
jgi:hypothetical protein